MNHIFLLVLLVFFSGCCQKQENLETQTELQTKQNTEVTKQKTEEEKKQEQFEQDVNWIYSYTLQHGFNPAKEHQVTPKENTNTTEE